MGMQAKQSAANLLANTTNALVLEMSFINVNVIRGRYVATNNFDNIKDTYSHTDFKHNKFRSFSYLVMYVVNARNLTSMKEV